MKQIQSTPNLKRDSCNELTAWEYQHRIQLEFTAKQNVCRCCLKDKVAQRRDRHIETEWIWANYYSVTEKPSLTIKTPRKDSWNYHSKKDNSRLEDQCAFVSIPKWNIIKAITLKPPTGNMKLFKPLHCHTKAIFVFSNWTNFRKKMNRKQLSNKNIHRSTVQLNLEFIPKWHSFHWQEQNILQDHHLCFQTKMESNYTFSPETKSDFTDLENTQRKSLFPLGEQLQ